MVAALINDANTMAMKTDVQIQLHGIVCLTGGVNIRRSYLVFWVPPSFKIEMLAALFMNWNTIAMKTDAKIQLYGLMCPYSSHEHEKIVPCFLSTT